MPAQPSLVLADGQATPANHTFVPAGSRALPSGVIESVFYDSDHAAGSGIDRWSLTERYTRATGRQTVDRVSYDLALNVGAIVDGSRKAIRTPRFVGTFYMPLDESSTFLWENLAHLPASLLAHADIKGNVANRRAFW